MEGLIELQKACDTSAGLVLKRKEARCDDKVAKIYKTITLKSFNDDGWIDLEYLDDYKSGELLNDRYLTRENDILIRLSNPYTAIKITSKEVGFVIPSLFAIVRINHNGIMPGYLSFVLNSDKIKQSYFKNSMGITIPVIRMNTIRKTKISILSLSEQHNISKIYGLMIREKKLFKRLNEMKKIYNRETTKNIIKKGEIL